MSTLQEELTIDKSKAVQDRPTIITIVCVLGFIGALVTIPAIFSDVARNVGAWYPPFLAIGGIVGLISILGLWKMKKWAVLLYTAGAVIIQIVLLAMGHWNVIALVFPGIVIAIMFSQISKMR
jgi:hypothetical protein